MPVKGNSIKHNDAKPLSAEVGYQSNLPQDIAGMKENPDFSQAPD
jgi:hypothetical protein